MTAESDETLLQAIKAVSAKVSRFKEKGLGEQNTKASMIEPILESLGWDIRDPEEVHREFKPTSKDSPVDYALKILRKPRLFVEAKGLGGDLSERKWIAQVLGYATVAGVEWCVLSDGDEYRFYNATAALDAEEKLFCKLRLSEVTEADPVNALRLISRSNMEENLISVIWSAHFVDRQVRELLRNMIESADKRLVRLIRAGAMKLTSKEIIESLRRLDVRIDQPADVPDNDASDGVELQGRSAAAKRAWNTRRAKNTLDSELTKPMREEQKLKKSKAFFAVSLADLIREGLLKPPVKLFRKYKGTQLAATLKSDGTVEFQGVKYPTASTSAEFARSTVTGTKMNTNGWEFWKCADLTGKTTTLNEIRSKFLKAKSPSHLK